MSGQIAYGVFCDRHYASLVTPDKQLHIGPSIITGSIDDHWTSLANTIAWLENHCPGYTFTLVIDELKNFDNPYYWTCNKIMQAIRN